jgi:hypothetical protein
MSTQSYRSLRDGSFFKPIPGSELPGYLHLVPPGQTRAPAYILVSTPAEHHAFEDEDSLPDVAFSMVGCQLHALAKSERRVRGRKKRAWSIDARRPFTSHLSPLTSHFSRKAISLEPTYCIPQRLLDFSKPDS